MKLLAASIFAVAVAIIVAVVILVLTQRHDVCEKSIYNSCESIYGK